MNCLVTGGVGFIGSHLAEKLLKDGHNVIVVDDFSLGKEENLSMHKNNPNLKIKKESILNNLDKVFEGEKFDVVFHLAAIPRVQFSIAEPQKSHDANINGTLNLLLTCKKFGVKRFVFSSSSSVYGNQTIMPLTEELSPNPISPYALHKLVGEHYCRLFTLLYKMETISLRYFNVYGPRQSAEGGYACLIPRFFTQIMNNEQPIINGDGEQKRDFTFVTDVVEANILAAITKNAKCFGEAFNVGASNNKSVNEVTNEILALCKSSIKPIYGPSVVEPKETLASIKKTKSFLGWEPKIRFEDGMKMIFESLK